MITAPRVMVIGAGGQIGSELCQLSQLPVLAVRRRELDLRYLSQVDAILKRYKPDVVINASGYTAVEKAEIEPQEAFQINAAAPAYLANVCKAMGAVLIHYSTDYVFDGRSKVPYREEDFPSPLSVYGRSKLEGEQGILSNGGKCLVFRTSWIYDSSGKNFVAALLRKARSGESLPVVTDQIGSPTWARDVAAATLKVVKVATRNSWDKWGLYHLTAAGHGSWYDFAKLIGKEYGFSHKVLPCVSADYASAVQRPAYSVLSNERFGQVFGFKLGPWRDRFAAFCAIKESGDCAFYS